MATFNSGQLFIDGEGFTFGSEGKIDNEKAIAMGDIVQTTLLAHDGETLDYIKVSIDDKWYDLGVGGPITEDVAAAMGQATMRLLAAGMNRKLKGN